VPVEDRVGDPHRDRPEAAILMPDMCHVKPTRIRLAGADSAPQLTSIDV
jgi:hypothetical protein